MHVFNVFSFDAIILLVFALFLFMGIYFGLRKQLGIVLQLGLPPVILYFLFDEFLFLHEKIFKTSTERYVFNALFVYILAYLILFFLIGLLYGLIKPPVRKRVLERPRIYSRIVGGVLGLVSAFLFSSLLLYFLKPVLGFHYRSPLTKVMVAADNRVLTLSKLNRYQYVNVDKYREYDEALALFTGRAALDFYEETKERIESLPELETKIAGIRPLLSSASADLFGEGKLSELVRKDGKKRVYQRILDFEKENEDFSEINQTFSELQEKQAYVLLAEIIDETSFPALMEALDANLGEVLAEFPDLESRLAFERGHGAALYYLDNGPAFRKHLPEAGAELEHHVLAFETMLSGDPAQFAESFLAEAGGKYPQLGEAFRAYLRNREAISELPKNLTFAAKIVLAEEAKHWFVNHLWEDVGLLKHYLFDALGNPRNRSHRLYSEYFFVHYLASADEYEHFGGQELLECLNELEVLVQKGLLPRELAEKYVANLFLEEDSILAMLAGDGFSEMLEVEHEFLPENLKAELAKRGKR